jgi:hypothetical protein
MLPELPRLVALVSAAQTAQGFCPGTIRFSIGRAYEQTLTAIRLHRTEFWAPGNKWDSQHDAKEEPFRAAREAEIAAAANELAAYYARSFHLEESVAQVDARSAINAAVVRAFFHCGG